MTSRAPSFVSPMTLPAAARALGVDVQVLRYRILKGDLPSIRVGNYHLISLLDAERALEMRPYRAPAKIA